MEQTRSFLNSLAQPLLTRTVLKLPPLLRYGVYLTSLLALASITRHAITTAMGLPQASTQKQPATQPLPRKRRMVHLKTKEECRLGNETIEVWSVELPSRHAEGVLKVIKEKIEGQDSIDLQHLRRFAKPKYLPPHVLGERDLMKELYSVPVTWSAEPAVLQTPNASWEWSIHGRKRSGERSPTLYLLVCPSNVISLSDLHDLLIQERPFCSSADSWAYPLEIKRITVPRLAPTSQEQAAEWSDKYWPTFYRKTNPFGAHPATIAKGETELEQPENGNVSIEAMMELAEQAGTATEKLGYGICTGCVIVERADDRIEIIAVAGDARGKPLPSEGGSPDVSLLDISLDDDDASPSAKKESKKGGGGAFAKKTARKKRKKEEERLKKVAEQNACSSGNVMCHAVMRAIGMVGRKRLRVASQPVTSRAARAEDGFFAAGLERNVKARDAFFLDLPVTPLEQQYFDLDNLKPDGYLCLKLEIVLTHEPCVMCSMALVHSRVGKVIFKHRMPQTGGLTAELTSNDTGPVGLGYGLCWRKELNWQFMCWEWTANRAAIESRDSETQRIKEGGADYRNGQRPGYGGETDDEDSASEDLEHPFTFEEKLLDDANTGMPSLTRVHV